MKRLFAVVALLATPAMAQQTNQPAEYNLKVTPAEIDILSEGLQTQPFGKVFPLINKLREQVLAQQPKVTPVPPADPAKPADAPAASDPPK